MMKNKIKKGIVRDVFCSDIDKNKHYEISKVGEHRHGMCKWFYANGQLSDKEMYVRGDMHGVCRYWESNGDLKKVQHYIYGEEASEEEWREHRLTEQLAGI